MKYTSPWITSQRYLTRWSTPPIVPPTEEHRTAYVQHTAPAQVHDTDWRREALEALTRAEFSENYPSYVVTDSGWKPTYVTVMES